MESALAVNTQLTVFAVAHLKIRAAQVECASAAGDEARAGEPRSLYGTALGDRLSLRRWGGGHARLPRESLRKQQVGDVDGDLAGELGFGLAPIGQNDDRRVLLG